MIRTLYLSPEGQLRKGLPLEEVKAVLASQEGTLWVDCDMPSEAEAPSLEEVFGFHPLALEDALNNTANTPKVDDYGDYLFIVCQSASYDVRADLLHLSELDLFVGRNYVVTVHVRRLSFIDDLITHARPGGTLLSRGADFLAYQIMDGLVDLLLPTVQAMDEALDNLERRILLQPERHLLENVLRLKRSTLRMRRTILPQRDLVNRISRGEFGSLIGNDTLIFFRDIYDHTVRIEDMIEGLRDLADGALNSYLSSVNNRMNEIMKTLSIVSAIFLPLTLIASIFGTNLDYSPGSASLDSGFFVMLGFMLLLAFSLIAYFRYRDWF